MHGLSQLNEALADAEAMRIPSAGQSNRSCTPPSFAFPSSLSFSSSLALLGLSAMTDRRASRLAGM
jgi:hypothetical protein